MKSRLTAIVMAGVALAATTVVSLGGPALAAGTPPWEPDTHSLGGLTFYNAAGTVITGGTDISRLADFIAASTPGRTGTTKATLYLAAPDHTKADPLQWAAVSGSASTNFPVSAPSSVAAITNPVVSVGASDASLTNFLATATVDSTAGYANLIQLRVKDSGIGKPFVTSYWSADIEYNPASATTPLDGLAPGAWKVVYPAPVGPTKTDTTTTAPVATPAGPVASGTSITLSSTASETATPANHPAGTIQFKDGAANQGAAIAVSAGGVATTPSFVPADGAHSFTAVFTPTDTATFNGSTSSALAFTVNGAPAAATSTAITGITPASTADTSTPVVVTAHVTNTVTAGTIPTGTVAITESASTYGSATVDASGNATVTIPASVLSVGAHSFTAAYTHSGSFGDSTSTPSSYAITLAVPANVSLPTISGARVGVASTCSAGTWTYAGTYSYAWYLDASVTPFATTVTSGVLPASYVNHVVSCVVTAKNPGGQATASSAKAKVAPGAASRNTVRPKIVGSLAVGRVLVASRGTWVPAATTYLYVWKRGAVIVSKTAKYKTTARDKGKTLVVYVYAVRAGYVTGAAVSVAVRIR